MTSQLVILGNGFDLQCGLKSRYEDFFKSSILNASSENSGHPAIRKDCSGFWETLLFGYYIQYGDKDYKWCDIEAIIKDTLLNIINVEFNSAFICVYNKRDPIEDARHIDDEIRRYLFKYCATTLYSFLTQTQDFSEQKMLSCLMRNLLQELKNFERRFCNYIKDCIMNSRKENQLNTDYIINAVNLLKKITGFSNRNFVVLGDIIHKELKEFEEIISPSQSTITIREANVLSKEFLNLKHTHILSFNYTNIFDILDVKSPFLYSNVHGKLCNSQCNESCSLSNIIFGIDDNIIQSQSKDTELQLFSKTYRKMFNTNTPTSILPPNDDTPVTLKFYGHSLSAADYSYFQSIFDYYNLYSNSNISLNFYYSERHEQTDAIYRLINIYGKSLSNKEQGKNLIHKLLLENRLNIIKIS